MILYRSGFRWVAMLMIAALAAIGAPPAHAKSPVVTGVQVINQNGKLMVHVAATGAVQYTEKNLNDQQPQLVVDITPAQLATNIPKSFEVGEGLVERVRVGQFSDNPDVVRVVVDLKAPVKYQIVMAKAHNALTVAISSNQTAPAQAPKADAPVSTTAPASTATLPTVEPAGDNGSPRFTPAPGGRPSKVQVVASGGPMPDLSPNGTYVVHNTPKQVARTAPRRGTGGRRYYTGRLVSLDFVNADIIYVLKILAKELGKNIVFDNTVKGSVTMSLKDVNPTFALQLILRIANFDYGVVNNTIIVGSKDTIAAVQASGFGGMRSIQPGTPLPIPLEHAKAASIAETVKSVYPDVKVTVQADQNFIVVSAPKDQLATIKEFVQKLDVPPPPPVVLKTEIVPVKYATVQTVLQLAKTLFPGLNYNVEDRLNSLIVTGQDKDIEAMKAFLATVDIPLQQVMLDIRMVSLSEDGSKTLGVSLGSSTGTFGVFAGAGGSPITFTEGPFPGNTTSTQQLAIAPFTRTPFVIGATISMLVTRNDAKLIATPRVMTQSGKDAQVLIGDKFPIVYFDPRAGQFQVQYVDIGVKLIVKPTVSADGFVTMDMTPEVSVLKALINNQYPRTGVTTVKTNVRVRDGDTMVIGGLLREAETYSVSKLPFLGDLPILGEFFRQTTVQRTKDEVFITVTPKIMP